MRKRTTKKTGNFTKSTTTISSKRGTTQSNSFRPPGGATRRTVSFNHKTGKTRTTYTTHHGGGWSTTRSKTTGGGKAKSSSGRRSRASSGGGDAGGEMLILLIAGIFVGIFWLFWKLMVAMYQAAEATVKKPETEENTENLTSDIWHQTKVFGVFCGYLFILALLVYFVFTLGGKNDTDKPPIIPASVESLMLDKPTAAQNMEYRGEDGPIGPIQLSE